MNKQNITVTESGRRTTGLRVFFDGLPPHVRPVQKSIPPYMRFSEGFGYLGVLLLDTEKDRVQCHFCGYWYKALSAHIKVHGIKAKNYKDKTGLYRKEPLMSLRTFRLFKANVASKANLQKTGNIQINRAKVGTPNGSSTMQWKNKYGTCDAQLGFRLEEAIKKYGRLPYRSEEHNLAYTIKRRFGSWEQGLKNYGYTPTTPQKNARVSKANEEGVVALSWTPTCRVCAAAILRKKLPSGAYEDRAKWLKKKTCSSRCKTAFLQEKWPTQKCDVDGCENKYSAKGYCNRHYLEFVKRERVHHG